MMVSVLARRSFALVLLAVAGAAAAAAGGGSNRSFKITNHCSYTVWPGILSGAAAARLDDTGFKLAPGESRTVSWPSSGTSGLVWGRTLCSTDAATGRFACLTGDCGSGRMDCAGGGGPAPPATLALFTLDGSGGMDSYGVSLVDGSNLPVVVAPPLGHGGNCALAGCAADLNGACPAELRVTWGTTVVACKSACQAFGSAQYCCTGPNYGSPSTCKPTAYSELFKHACPRAYSYAYDGAGSTLFTCAAGDTSTYSITFCPSTTSAKASTMPSSEAPGRNGNSIPLINNGSGGTTGGSAPNTGGGGAQPWGIALAIAVLGVVAAVLGVLAQFLGLFNLCCKSPTEESAGSAAGCQHYPRASIQINNTYT